MAFSRALLISLLLSFVFLNLLRSHQAIAGAAAATHAPSLKAPINCAAACKYRCSKSWKPKMCNKMCKVCCSKCRCVPPGPTANRNVCSCYAKLRNSKTGAYKCP